jgi:hypothetical protein
MRISADWYKLVETLPERQGQSCAYELCRPDEIDHGGRRLSLIPAKPFLPTRMASSSQSPGLNVGVAVSP